MRYRQETSLILVGHSHFFREMMRHCTTPEVTATDAEGCVLPDGDLHAKKLCNAGIAKCELDFAASPDQPFTGVRLLFNTTLVS